MRELYSTIQWNLYSGHPWDYEKCPVQRGVLISEVDLYTYISVTIRTQASVHYIQHCTAVEVVPISEVSTVRGSTVQREVSIESKVSTVRGSTVLVLYNTRTHYLSKRRFCTISLPR